MTVSKFFREIGGLLRRHRRRLLFLLCGAGATVFLCLGVLILWMLSCRVPDEAVQSWVPGCEIFDYSGNLVEVRRGSDWRWCLPISLADVPPELVEDVIAVEDQRFRSHSGVDFRAMCRAGMQMLGAGRVVSGASTITMQVVNQYCGRQRGIIYKLRQMGMALNWEKEHGKEEILEDYFNMLPYGGKLHGIEAASRYYFGRSARELNRSEQLLLVGLPQSPNRFRPDRHPERAVWRRDVVLIILQRAGRLSPEEAQKIREMPLRYRDFSHPCWPQAEDRDFIQLAVSRHPGRSRLHLSWEQDKQLILRRTLEDWRDTLPGVSDGAGVIIHNATGQVRALVNTLRNGDPAAAQVSVVTALRSPGSTFKPFIYGEAINGGLITADTRILDAPLGLQDYRPGNFSGDFLGEVSAAQALGDSLNTPAVRLLAQLTPLRLLEVLHLSGAIPAGQSELSRLAKRGGLSLAIGGVESTLLHLTAAYSALGTPRKALLLTDEVQPDSQPYWHPGTAALLLEMMRFRKLAGSGTVNAAWKTGTSNGNRDAWCFAVTPEWTVGIWFGNKNGRAAEALVGGTAAAPAAGRIISTLHHGIAPIWPDNDQHFRETQLCPKTGLIAAPSCGSPQTGISIADIPLLPCTLCTGNAAAAASSENAAPNSSTAKIISPAPGTYRANHEGTATFILRLEPAQCHIYLDGQHLGIYNDGDQIKLAKGTWQLLAWSPQRPAAAHLRLTVE